VSALAGSLVRGATTLAEVVRGGIVESAHLGHLVVLDPGGDVVLSAGEPTTAIWPRSSVKPLQAVAMLRHGLDLPDRLLALAASSHNGEPQHVAAVREILDAAGLRPEQLRNTPDLPLHAPSALAWQQAGNGPDRLTQNCSGKHAAMLTTCVAAGWDTESYLEAEHPLHRAIRATLAELTGDEPAHTTVDGCGAPLFSTSLAGLARAFARLVSDDDPDLSRVARAVSQHPEMVGGTGRDVTQAIRAVPGLVAKDGAEGVYAAALPSGAAVAFKVLDGGARARPAILTAALRAAGADDAAGVDREALDALARVPVLGGGQPVGEVRAAFEAAA
jgi:L-asparaginase II